MSQAWRYRKEELIERDLALTAEAVAADEEAQAILGEMLALDVDAIAEESDRVAVARRIVSTAILSELVNEEMLRLTRTAEKPRTVPVGFNGGFDRLMIRDNIEHMRHIKDDVMGLMEDRRAHL